MRDAKCRRRLNVDAVIHSSRTPQYAVPHGIVVFNLFRLVKHVCRPKAKPLMLSESPIDLRVNAL